jgi:superfamily I DNA and/or RNA helicase
MKKKMKAKYLYSVKTEYGDTEIVHWNELIESWVSEDGKRSYEENEFVSASKLKEIKDESIKGE